MGVDTGLLIAAVIFCFIVSTLVASVAGWVLVGLRIRAGEPILSPSGRPPLPASLADLLLVFLLLAALQVSVLELVRQWTGLPLQGKLLELPASEQLALLLIGSLTNLAAAALSALILFVRSRFISPGPGAVLPPPPEFTRTPRRGLKTGLFAFAILAPPVLALQMTLSVLWQPTRHPLIKMLEEDPDISIFLAAGLSAVIAAPIFEEYVFRGLLQSWLERTPLVRQQGWVEWLFGISDSPSHSPSPFPSHDSGERTSESVKTSSELEDPGQNPYKPTPSPAELASEDESKAASPVDHSLSLWPIFASALLFALMHFGHGPDPIPLFFFALGLGYLYQRTRSLPACILVHFLLNAFTMALLFLQVFYGDALGLDPPAPQP